MQKAIVTIVKNEHRYLEEWVVYHLFLGFNKIIIYEDYGSKSHKEICDTYTNVELIPLSKTEVLDFKGTKTQRTLFDYALKKYKGTYDWILFSDPDEFLILEQPLEKLLNDYNDYTGIILDWKLFNANKHITRPEGGIMENYTQDIDILLDNSPVWNKKSFVNLNKAESWLYPVHIIKDGVDVEFNPDYLKRKKVFKKAWLNHYFCKSWEDFVERITERGNMNNWTRTYDLFFKVNPDMVSMEDKMIESMRYIHTKKTMWISIKKKIISGGNIDIINKLKQNLIYGK